MKALQTATGYMVSKTLSKEALENTVEKVIKPLYGYQGGKPAENLLELSYGLNQMNCNLIPKSFNYFENKQKIGYFQSNTLLPPLTQQDRTTMKELRTDTSHMPTRLMLVPTIVTESPEFSTQIIHTLMIV